MTISVKLLKTLRKGKERLGTDALSRIKAFVGSQRSGEDSFMDKSGKPDIYYTLFGWMLSYVLEIPLHKDKTAAFLGQQETENMDLIHYAAYIRCRLLRQLMFGGKINLLLKSFFPTDTKRNIRDFSGLPNNDPESPYTRFIGLSLQEDTGQKIADKAEILESLENYRVAGGGFSNIKGGTTAATNATVAALAVIGQLAGYRKNEDVDYLRELQEESGGFGAAKEAPVPDLLSTATSLFMLQCYEISPKFDGMDFIEAHWLDSGGFSATLLEDKSDVEYTFYGLLALGNI